MKTYTVEVHDEGTKYWFLNGKFHREDGPAIEWSNGNKRWYLNDVELTQKEFNTKMNPNTCNGRIVVIDGKSYKLQEVK